MLSFATTPAAPVTTTLTRETLNVLALADRVGFAVTHPYKPYRGADEFALSLGAEMWGVIVVGARTGRIIRASIYDARTKRTVRANGARETRAILNGIGS